MKPIPTFVHGIVDYLTAFALLAAPRLLGQSRRVRRILGAAGTATLLYSLLTRYELGIFRVIPMKGHLALDSAQSALIATSPIFLPKEPRATKAALLGLAAFELFVTANSQSEPSRANMLTPLTTDVYTVTADDETSLQ